MADIVSPRPVDLLATYHVEGLYDMVGLGSWNNQPVSETNQPSAWVRRLAADVSCYRDEENDRSLWITITNVVTTQGASWWGAPSRDVQLTGLGFSFATAAGLATAVGLNGDFALAGQQVLTSAGATPADSTPGYGLTNALDTTWIRCTNGTDYGVTNFGWVSGLTVLTGSAVFLLEMDRPIQAIDWNSTSLTARFGVDHQFVNATLIPAPGAMWLLLVASPARRRRC